MQTACKCKKHHAVLTFRRSSCHRYKVHVSVHVTCVFVWRGLWLTDPRRQRNPKHESTHMTLMTYIADLMFYCQIYSERGDNADGQQSSASWRHTFHFKIIIKTNHWKNYVCFFLCPRPCFLFRTTDFNLKVILRHHYLLYFLNVFYVKILLF